jgi:hypothetical protein
MVIGKETLGFYGYFSFVCLLAGYEHSGFYFLTALTVSWFLLWMHFRWCGCFCADVLMDINQAERAQAGDKRWSVSVMEQS